MKTKLKTMAARAGAIALVAMPYAAHACDQCMGAKDPNLRPAVNGAIFFMLGTVGFMAGLVGLCMFRLAKRSNSPLAPHQQLVQMMTMPERPNHV